MKLFKIERTDDVDYDEYDSAVVAAETESDAKSTQVGYESQPPWAKPEFIKVTYIGEAAEGTVAGVIMASFNAG